MAYDFKAKMEMRQCIGCTAKFRVLMSSTQDFCSDYCRNLNDDFSKISKQRPEVIEVTINVSDEKPRPKDLKRTYGTHKRFKI